MAHDGQRSDLFAPLELPVFRNIWIASLFSNFGYLIQVVGAAWAMTELARAADMVALVQTASISPMMLFALLAGAVADTYDRRKVALCSLAISILSASGLAIIAWCGMPSPALILLFTFLVGTGMALFAPAWQASVPEMVPMQRLPAAISLNSISFNIARSFGPAIGGLIVAAAGATAAFIVTALFYLPMLGVQLLWRRKHEPPRLPPERLWRAVVSGTRYAVHSPAIRTVLWRSLLIGAFGCVLAALMPLIARDLLGGDARTYGLSLGAFGVGAVLGAVSVGRTINRLGLEAGVRGSVAAMAIACLVIALSRHFWLTGGMLILAGAGWMMSVTILNIVIQTVAPRWVGGRALAAFQTAVAGGMALGSWGWGWLANLIAVQGALLVAAVALAASLAVGLWLRLPTSLDPVGDTLHPDELPDLDLAISDRSGPIVIEVEYRVQRDDARAFYGIMQDVQFIRRRNGAYDWSIARELADAELWTERFHCPTWMDYLRQRSRLTQADRALIARAFAYHRGVDEPRVRRKLERPFGSVRWRDDVPDTQVPPLWQVSSGAAGP